MVNVSKKDNINKVIVEENSYIGGSSSLEGAWQKKDFYVGENDTLERVICSILEQALYEGNSL